MPIDGCGDYRINPLYEREHGWAMAREIAQELPAHHTCRYNEKCDRCRNVAAEALKDSARIFAGQSKKSKKEE